MNIEQTKAAISVMQAYVDGKEIEFRSLSPLAIQGWFPVNENDLSKPEWSWSTADYRIQGFK